jgi:hypothetical protein
MREPRTHYDKTDNHHYDMHDVLDPPELNDLVDHLERQNIIYIKGIAYELASYGECYSDGSRYATLRLWSPF